MLTWKPNNVQQNLILADMEGEFDDLKEELECPKDMWLYPPPLKK